jgi:hypothetical protein
VIPPPSISLNPLAHMGSEMLNPPPTCSTPATSTVLSISFTWAIHAHDSSTISDEASGAPGPGGCALGVGHAIHACQVAYRRPYGVGRAFAEDALKEDSQDSSSVVSGSNHVAGTGQSPTGNDPEPPVRSDPAVGLVNLTEVGRRHLIEGATYLLRYQSLFIDGETSAMRPAAKNSTPEGADHPHNRATESAAESAAERHTRLPRYDECQATSGHPIRADRGCFNNPRSRSAGGPHRCQPAPVSSRPWSSDGPCRCRPMW